MWVIKDSSTLFILFFCKNLAKCWSISIIISLSHSQMNCKNRWNKLYLRSAMFYGCVCRADLVLIRHFIHSLTVVFDSHHHPRWTATIHIERVQSRRRNNVESAWRQRMTRDEARVHARSRQRTETSESRDAVKHGGHNVCGRRWCRRCSLDDLFRRLVSRQLQTICHDAAFICLHAISELLSLTPLSKTLQCCNAAAAAAAAIVFFNIGLATLRGIFMSVLSMCYHYVCLWCWLIRVKNIYTVSQKKTVQNCFLVRISSNFHQL